MRGAFRPRGLGTVPCPWGCELGPDGWSGAPFCPRHSLPAAKEREAPGQTRTPSEGSAAPPGPGPQLEMPIQLLHTGTWAESGAWGGFGPGPRFRIRLSQLEDSGEEDEYEEEEEPEEEEEWLPWWERGSVPLHVFPGAFLSPEPPAGTTLDERLCSLPMPRSAVLSAEEAERNARELVAEEERAKKKAEKKKLKKKKQKDRKKREKLGQEQKIQQESESGTASQSGTADARDPQSSCAEDVERQPDPSPSPGLRDNAVSSGEEGEAQEPRPEDMEEELDLSCSFVCKAWQKAGIRLPAPGKEQAAGMGDMEQGRREPGKVPELNPVPQDTSAVERSLILAGHGNAEAQQGRYAVAVQAFSDAIRLNPWEHRLLGNRSYCYEKLGCFEEALSDALVALALQPAWAKGLFRKGKALRGLQRYAEAARTFEELLRMDGSSTEVRTQLEECQALLRQSSPRERSSTRGVPVAPSLPEAAEPPLLPPAGQWVSRSCCNMDTNTFETAGSPRSQTSGQGRAAASGPRTLPPSHPARDCFPLWVGTITASISEKVLRDAFSRFGEIRSIRTLPKRRCAFINFARKKAAEAAYTAMQAVELEGCRLALQLKHPSHATPAPSRLPQPHTQGGAPPGERH